MHVRTRRHTIAAMLATAGLVAGSGIAAAQNGPRALPGTNDSATQIAVGYDNLAEVEVNAVDAESTEVTGTFTNNSDGSMECRAAGETQGDAGTVTTAALVDRSLAYVTNNLVAGDLGLPIDTGSLDVMLGSGSLGSLGLGDPAAVELDAIKQAQDQARLAGQYGAVDEFTVAAGDSEEWTATLSVPSGDRTDFDAAALFTCVQDEQWYAFAGYEEDDSDDDNGGGGSLSMGSLGS